MKCGKDEACRSVSGRLCNHSDTQTRHSYAIQADGGVDHVPQCSYTEQIDQDVRYQHHGEYAKSPAGRRFVTMTDLRRGGNKVRQAEVNPRGDGNLS